MEEFFAPCCEKCTHSPQTPCSRLLDCLRQGPLCHDDAACRGTRRSRLLRLAGPVRPAGAAGGPDVWAMVWVGTGTCGMAAGAGKVFEVLQQYAAQTQGRVVVKGVGCRGLCYREPMVDVQIAGRPRVIFGDVTRKNAERLISYLEGGEMPADLAIARVKSPLDALWGSNTVPARPEDGGSAEAQLPWLEELPSQKKQMRVVLANCGLIDPDSLAEYVAAGGYEALADALQRRQPEEILHEVEISGLRGRGGGGFPTGRKWRLLRQAKGEPKYLICNADEGDPGAFMDRSVLEGDPHRVLEGMMLAAYATGARYGYIYVRAEYPLAVKRLRHSIAQLKEVGLLGENILGTGFAFDIRIKVGAGAFVCGEETALMASIEGRRGMPRPRPPFPAQSGLWGHPTNINNVETYANVPPIVRQGGAWFAGIGTEGSKGTKVFALTGKVKNTGLVEVPMGTLLRDLIYEVGGGMGSGHAFKAVQIGGPSGGCLPESMLDTPIDYDSLIAAGAMMGSGGLVVMDDTTCMVDVARFFTNFTRDESCGKCVPCREGLKRLSEILEQIVGGSVPGAALPAAAAAPGDTAGAPVAAGTAAAPVRAAAVGAGGGVQPPPLIPGRPPLVAEPATAGEVTAGAETVPAAEGTAAVVDTSLPSSLGPGLDPLVRFKNVTLLETLAEAVRDTAACGLGQTAPNPVLSTLRYFRDEYEAHVFERRCPAKHCKALLHYRINPNVCNGCGACARRCPQKAIVGEKLRPHYIIEDKCARCGMCAETCRFHAVTVE